MLAPRLSTLYSNVSSSYWLCRCDATSFPFLLSSIPSHHSHSLLLTAFPRCGVDSLTQRQFALLCVRGWNILWHFSLRPVAETPANHLSLSGLLPLSHRPGNCGSTQAQRRQKLTPVSSPCCAQVNLSPPVKQHSLQQQQLQTPQAETFPQAPPREGAASFSHDALWEM